MRRTVLAVCLVAGFFAWYAPREWLLETDSAVMPLPSDTITAPLPTETLGVAQPVEPPAEPKPKPVLAQPQSNEPWGAKVEPISTAASFVYPKNHPATPLPALAFAAMADEPNADEFGPIYVVPEKPFDTSPGQVRLLSRNGLCSAIVAVAQANDLPIPFFANLIWQESSFKSRTISRAGALGIAQFIPETAVEHGLMNPFEPIHALFASGRLLRKLYNQFGNLGLAAAAYNAGPQRVYDWINVRRGLPAETRAYVIRITGHRADRWLSSAFRRDPEATLMPARAPCAEVTAEVNEQAHFVRVAKLMSNLVAATSPPPPQDQSHIAATATDRAKIARIKTGQTKPAEAKTAQTKTTQAKTAQAKTGQAKTAQTKTTQAKTAEAKFAGAKPVRKKLAASQTPAVTPEPRIAGAKKDQSKPPATRGPGRSVQAAVRPIAAE